MDSRCWLRAIRLSFEAIDRRLETPHRRSAPTRWTFLTYAAAGAAGIIAGFVLCFARRSASSARHHLRLQHSGRDADAIGAIYTFTQIPGGTPQPSGWCWSRWRLRFWR